MKRRILCTLLAVLMVLSTMAMIPMTAFAADKEEIPVTWISGYVGGDTNSSNKNKLSGASATYKYSDIIVVEKAGTKISFTDDSNVGDSSTMYCSNTAYVFSTWKQSGSSWIIDLDGANVTGSYQYESLCQKRAGATENDGMLYEFVTDHDNQAIRLCYRCTASDTSTPKVYKEATTEKSTLQTIKDNELTATLADNGKITGLRWSVGYLGSAVNTNGSATNLRYSSSSYAVTNLFMVPKAGTTITYSLSCSPNANYDAFARYELNAAGRYQYVIGFNATDTEVRTGSNPYTYSYTTSKDNEVLRIGCRPGTSCTDKVAIDKDPIEVKWALTGNAGTGSTEKKTEWPDPELISILTGAPLVGEEVKNLKWVNGYVGSQYQDNTSKRFVYTSPSNKDYYTSDAFTVPKAGTRVVFFDQTFTDFDGGTLSSTSVITLSHWKSTGAFDKSKAYYTGCDIYQIALTEKYRVYEYTTTEDNELIRLCLRYAPMYSTEKALIPPVYLVEPTDFAAKTEATSGSILPDSYTDPTGAKVEFGYYLPKDYSPNRQYSLVFDASEDSAVAKSLAENLVKDAIVISFPVNDKANDNRATLMLRLLDEVVHKYPVKVSDILFVGGDVLGAHAASFECIRLCQAMIYTGTDKAPALKYAAVKSIGDFADAKAAADWLIGEYDDYYPVLEGKKLYAIGDSYFGGSSLGQHQTWVNLIGYEYAMTFHNFGIGGNTVAKATGIGSNQPPMCTRYTELPTDGDIYLIEGGRNDRHYSVPFGANDSKDPTTFTGAINIIIDYIRSKNPDALIVLVTPWNRKQESGYLGTNNKYADTMKGLADYYNDKHIVCLYAADTKLSGVDMDNASFRAKYCLTSSDVSHMNADGMYMVKDNFEPWLAEKYAALIGAEVINFADGERYNEPDPIETEPDVTTDDVPEVTTDAPAETTSASGGCGSFAPLAFVALIPTVFFFRRKKED